MKKMFFIIGCQRSGTTFLYNLLVQHPEISMSFPVRPEPKFFINKRDVNDLRLYFETYFKYDEHAKILGEKSTSYIEHKIALKQIKHFFPNSQILIMLRNPVERTISNYNYSKNNGVEHRDIYEALFSESKANSKFHSSVNPFLYLERSAYSHYLDRVYSIFDKDKIKCIISEELFSNQHLINEIYNFLDVDSSIQPKDFSVQNSSLKNDVVPDNVREKLTNYFKEEKKTLQDKYNIHSSLWE